MYPTMPLLPVHIEDIKYPRVQIIHNGREVNYFRKSIFNTDITACLDFPSISIPFTRDMDEEEGGELSVNMEFCV